MSSELPLGELLPNWSAPPKPSVQTIEGRYARLEKLHPDHAAALFANDSTDADGVMWTYLGVGPFETLEDYAAWVETASNTSDPYFFAFCDAETHEPLGTGSLMRIDPASGSIEIGWLAYSPKLQRTRIATECISLLIRYCFELGYRRCEWKCNALNAPSCRAAERFGFTYEGTFRQATISKGRNRDTAWYSIIDKEWPSIRAAHEAWLDPANFDADGRQIQPLKAVAL